MSPKSQYAIHMPHIVIILLYYIIIIIALMALQFFFSIPPKIYSYNLLLISYPVAC